MKRRLILTLALVLLLAVLPLGVQAAETVPQSTSIPFRVNPLYEDIYSPKDFAKPVPEEILPEEIKSDGSITASKESITLKAGTYLPLKEAAAQLRSQMKARAQAVEIYVEHADSDYNIVANDLLLEAVAHTGNPKEGDYLMWQFGGWGGEVYQEFLDNGNYGYQFILTLDYYTTAAQEAELDTAVKNLLNNLGVSGMSEYQKVKAVYDYIISNVTYDETHLNDDTYVLKHTAYAALVNKTAVCQGYSTLLYRLMLEMGIDCRVIAGETDGGAHAWNIAKLGNVYYNLDATWDAGYDDYAYFLRNSEGFADHYRYLDYATTQFHTDYPISATDYVEGVAGEPEHVYVYGMCGDDAYWSIDRDKVLTIFGTGETADFTSPQYEGEHVPWIYWLDGFDTVIVDKGITTIGECLFSGVSNIKHITLADSVTTVDMWAFENSTGLTGIGLGNGLEAISDCAFRGCSALTTIDFPESLESLGADSFMNCTSLTKVTIPESITVLNNYVFSGCTSLETVNLDNGSLTSIGDYAFQSCESLSAIRIPDSVTHIGEFAFRECLALSDITLGSGLTEIGYGVFQSCLGQSKLVLPEGLVKIDTAAFGNWDLLTEVTIPDSVTYLSGFSGCDKLAIIHMNSTVTVLGDSAFADCPSITSITFPESLTAIESEAFRHCHSLTEITIPDHVTSIGMYAFSSCDNLQSITLNNSGFMDRYAFSNNYNLTNITIGKNLTELGEYVFDTCNGLQSITIPENITSIGSNCFGCCASLNEIQFIGDAPEIAEDAFLAATATAYYPAHNPTWTEDKLQNYGGTLTWVDMHTHEYAEDDPKFNEAAKTHTWTCLTCDTVKSEACTFQVTVLEEATLSSAGLREGTCTVCSGSYEEQFPLRLFGANRYETAFIVADTLKAELGVEKFENIIVANGQAFADALAGSYLAVQKNAPILLVNQNRMEEVSDYIAENLAIDGTVYLLGGEAAIPAEMEELLDGLYFKRLAGNNRYLTNLEILAEAGIGDEEVLVCTGNGFADSLSASAVGKPILLVNKTLSDAQIEFLESSSGEFVIIGGESAVSAALAEELEAYGTVTRLGGANRYETSVLVAQKFFTSPTSAVLAYAQNFPDGLCGGPLAAAMNAPLLLIATNRGPAVIEYANETGITTGAVLGGTGLISDDTARAVFGLDENATPVAK